MGPHAGPEEVLLSHAHQISHPPPQPPPRGSRRAARRDRNGGGRSRPRRRGGDGRSGGGQYGADGFFIDGCTSPRVYCPWGRVCVVNTTNYIDTRPHYGHWVTQNARVRVFNSSGHVRWYHDRSCASTNTCWNHDSYAYIYGGESATSQCNGVRDRRLIMSTLSRNLCQVKVTYL